MRSSTLLHTRERARPLLGTIVRIRVEASHDADGAIDAAFTEIADIHRLMSFQEATSDVGRINQAPPGQCVTIDPRTWECLSAAFSWSERSGGAFDPVAATGCGARWHDLVLDDDSALPARPLHIDLSGIAKGYAVDRACVALSAFGVRCAMVEAGGDLRVLGDHEEVVALRPMAEASPAVVMIADGALASSDPALAQAQSGTRTHFNGRTGVAVSDRFVAVAAPRCIDADALTKIVLAIGDEADPLLDGAKAVAYRFDGGSWSTLGGAS